MIKKKYIDAPIEIDKWYMTKWSAPERFQVKKIIDRFRVLGIYEKSPHLGLCPLEVGALVNDKIEIGEINVCPHCNMPLV